MPRRDRQDHKEDNRRLLRQRRKLHIALIVGSSIGSVLILAAVVVSFMLNAGKMIEPGRGAAGRGWRYNEKPEGVRTTDSGEVRDASVVDKVWSHLRGRWDSLDPKASPFRFEFKADYSWTETGTDIDGHFSERTYESRIVQDDTVFALGVKSIPKGGRRYVLHHENGFITFDFQDNVMFKTGTGTYRRAK